MADKIGLKEAMSIGIGGMVGGGIFAVLGLAVMLAGGATPMAFLLAGIVALLTAYSYAKLSTKYPDNGGTVKFIDEGFGTGVFSGSINNLLWVSYIIMIGLYASAFGSYAPNLLKLTSNRTIDEHIYASCIILIATFLNYFSIKVVGKIESIVVVIKLVILIGFVFIGLYGLVGNPNIAQLSISNWESPFKIFGGGMVIFVAYEGFELIANAASDILKPEKNIARAYYYSVGFVMLLYIVIAIVTVGSLKLAKIQEAKDYVLAEAAKPMLGQWGFGIITVAALLSTFSAINATFYGGSKVSFTIAKQGELPHQLTGQWWGQPIGLAITTVASLILTNALNLESISISGSVGFLLIFAAVNFVGFKKRHTLKSNKVIHLCGFALCVIAAVVLLIQQFESNKMGVFVGLGIIVFCFVIEWVYKKYFANGITGRDR